MPKMTIFQKRKRAERDDYILQLAEEGYRLNEIAKIVKEKYRYPITRQRVHQIIQIKLQGEKCVQNVSIAKKELD